MTDQTSSHRAAIMGIVVLLCLVVGFAAYGYGFKDAQAKKNDSTGCWTFIKPQQIAGAYAVGLLPPDKNWHIRLFSNQTSIWCPDR